jgi:hypothetical protein
MEDSIAGCIVVVSYQLAGLYLFFRFLYLVEEES